MSVRDTGILRKKAQQPTTVDLSIVGYQSKLFRDDEKAQFIDQGRHLIGWMGSDSLKIDRYDVRATLSDLTPYEVPPGGYSNRLDYLTPAEQKAEQLCEEERYYSLYTNEIEEEAYQEEAIKRQQSGYGQVQFNYDGRPTAEQQPALPQHGPEEAAEEPDDPFEPLPNFEIPRHIEPPDTMRLNAIIEKTARFIAQQGVQMEILIKAKQSNNPQFDFLNMNGRCNLYYKYLVAAMKEGKYPEVTTTPKENGVTREAEEKKKKSVKEHASTAPSPLVPLVTSLKYVPSEDCAYSQLISKIQGKPISEIKPSTPEPTTKEVEKEKAATGQFNNKIEFKHKSNSVEVKKISSGLMLAQAYNSDSDEEQSDDEKGEGTNGHAMIQPESQSKTPESKYLEKLDVPVPLEDLRTIVDKTAAYVAKNGKDFEDILRTKKDPRFAFLDTTSPYHRYYIYKVTGSIIPAPVSPVKNDSNGTNGTQPPPPPPPSVVQPVSFTIKAQTGSVDNGPLRSEVKLDEDEEESASDGESLSVADLLEREERKEIRRVEERVRDKLAAAAREKLGLVSKEKQLQQERKKKAMAFLMKIKNNGTGVDEVKATSEVKVQVHDLTGNDGSSEAERTDDRKLSYRDQGRERSKQYRRSSRSRSRSPSHRREKRRSESRSKSKRKHKKSRRHRSSSSEGSRDRDRSRSRPKRSRERSRNR